MLSRLQAEVPFLVVKLVRLHKSSSNTRFCIWNTGMFAWGFHLGPSCRIATLPQVVPCFFPYLLVFQEVSVTNHGSSYAQRKHVQLGQTVKTVPVYCFPLMSPR